MSDTIINLADVPRPPRLDEYFGLWAVEGMRFMAGFDRVRTMDLVAHVRNSESPKGISRMVMTEVGAEDIRKAANYKDTGGYGYPEAQVSGGAGMKIAIIPVCGVIMKQVGSLDDGTSSVLVRRDIRHAANDPSIGGIMLLIDSPGGSVSGTPDLAAEVSAAAAKKPVYAFVEDLCASAAYWTASGASKIFANTATALVGSIGTYACLYDMSAAAAMQGVKAKLYATGPVKGAGTPGTEITPEQDAYFQGIVDQTQAHFTAAIAANRKMSVEKVQALATGAVYFAADAQKNGLIDGIKTFDQAIAMLGADASKARGGAGPTRITGDLIDLKADQEEVDAEKKKKKTDGGDSTTSGDSTAAGDQSQDSDDSTAAASAGVTPTTPQQEDAMSDPNQKKAASLQELKAALPGSTAEFRETCMEKGLSLEESAILHANQQTAALADVKAKSKRVGTDPVSTAANGRAETETQDAGSQLRTLADTKRKSGMSRSQAWAATMRENPDLREAYLKEYASASREDKARLRY